MANDEHVRIVRQGAEAIAEWRENNPGAQIDLSQANLRRIELINANHKGDYYNASLDGANLSEAKLIRADLRWADLNGADLSGADLHDADLHKAEMQGASLRGALLQGTNLADANLTDADLTGATFGRTKLLNTNFTRTKGLETVKHEANSEVGEGTLNKSILLPRNFLAGCGVSAEDIEEYAE